MRKYLLHTLLVALYLTAFYSCVQESVLSDVEITDPSVMTVYSGITWEQSNHYTKNSKEITSTFRDKNRDAFYLKGGTIECNGHLLTGKLDGTYEKEPRYFLDLSKQTILPDTKYEFKTTLSNGEVYSGSIRTPMNTFESFQVPSTLKRGDSLKFSWNPVDTNYGYNLYYALYNENDKHGDVVRLINYYDTDLGYVSIPFSKLKEFTFLNQTHSTKYIIVDLDITESILYDNEFNSDSQLLLRYDFTKKVTIVD